MDRLHPEILLRIFKRLNSKEMVSLMIVCREWLEVIDDNKSLWRSLVLPKRRNGEGWELSTVELFDRKSNSSLSEVSMQIEMEEQNVPNLIDILKRSEGTLRTLYLSGFNYAANGLFSDVCWKLSNLTSFRVFHHDRRHFPNVDLIEKEVSKGERKHFKVLWVITPSSLEEAFSKEPHRFDHLVSLRIQHVVEDANSLASLRHSSHSLKHLSITMRDDSKIPRDQFSAIIELPLLQVLEITVSGFQTWADNFPKWLKIPESCTIIHLHPQLLLNFPSISKLWLEGLSKIERLASMCPNLVELRILAIDFALKREECKREECDHLVKMLIERSKKGDEGMEIEGLKMVHLKRLILPFGLLYQGQLSQLEKLVEEVIDLKSVDRFFELEVDV